MRAPDFWSRPPEAPGLAARLLAPASALWKLATRRRLRRAGQTVGAPVICVGNLTAGGSGKTPTAIALVEALKTSQLHPAVVSRGYGGRLIGPVCVDPALHDASDVGDEPLLLAAFAPVFVARDRASACRKAVEAGADVLVLDDGFQNPSPAKDLSLVVVDAGYGFGNGRVIPAGPLREPVPEGLSRADAVIAVGTSLERAQLVNTWPPLAELPVLEANIAPLATGMDWEGLRVLAFAGIGRPQKFFETLRGQGAEIASTRAFPDHAAYHPRLLARLETEARSLQAQLVTTEKDAVRLPESFRRNVLVLPVRLHLEDQGAINTLLAPITGARLRT